MFNKNVIVELIITVCLTISMASACYCSPLRLMAMGDMQGIVEDESDYSMNIARIIDVNKDYISAFSSSNKYSSDLNDFNVPPKSSNPSRIIQDDEGVRSKTCFRLVKKINENVGIYIENTSRNIQSRLNATAVTTITTSEQLSRYSDYFTTLGIGYGITDNMSLGIGYDWYNDWSGDFNAAFGGLRYKFLNYELDMDLGEKKESQIFSFDTPYVNSKTVSRQRYLAALSMALFNDSLLLSFGQRSSIYFYDGYSNRYAGMQYKLTDNILLAYGISDADFADTWFFNKYSYNRVGLEIKPFFFNGLVLQCGLGEKRFSVVSQEENFKSATNITCGIQYALFDNISIEFAQKAYKGYLYLEDFDEYGAGSMPIPMGYNSNNYFSIDESNNYNTYSLFELIIKF